MRDVGQWLQYLIPSLGGAKLRPCHGQMQPDCDDERCREVAMTVRCSPIVTMRDVGQWLQYLILSLGGAKLRPCDGQITVRCSPIVTMRDVGQWLQYLIPSLGGVKLRPCHGQMQPDCDDERCRAVAAVPYPVAGRR
ncbi:hypothetical protein Bbelb_124740 [Branchiostoma belcheri]|nr:hypothetical protein Bbelb_124740 [Branchiostoma belcheri]